MKKIGKVFKVIGIVFLALIVLLTIALIIFVKTFDANKFKPQIKAAVSQALSREIDIGDIDLTLTLKRGLQFKIKNLTVSDDPNFSNQPFIKVAKVEAGVDVLGFIFKRELSSSAIIIEKPQISIVRNQDGRLNLQTIGPKEEKTTQPDKTSSAKTAAALPVLLINTFKIENAKVNFLDKFFDEPYALVLDKINFAITGFSLTKPFTVLTEAALFSQETNFKAVCGVSIDLKKQVVKISDFAVSTDLKLLSASDILAMPMLKKVPKFGSLTGKISLKLNPITVSQKGLSPMVAKVDIFGGQVVFPQIIEGVYLAIQQIDCSLSNLNLDFKTPFDVEAKLQYLSDRQDVWFKGKVAIDLDKQSAKVFDAKATLDLTNFSLHNLKETVAFLKDTPMPKEIAGDLSIDIKEAVVNAKGLSTLTSQAELSKARVRLKELPTELNKISAQATLNEDDIMIEKLSCAINEGRIEVKGKIKKYIEDQKFEIKVKAENIEVADLIDQSKAEIKLSGKLSANMEAQGEIKQLFESLEASGGVEISPVRIEGMNILKTVLDKISFLPNVTARVKGSLAKKYKDKLESEDTEINMVKADFSAVNQEIRVEPIEVEADEFSFSGFADSNFVPEYKIEGKVLIPQDLSNSMAQGVPELSYMYDDKNRILIPIYAQGKGAEQPKVKVTKIAGDIGKNFLLNQGRKLGFVNDSSEGESGGQQQEGKEAGADVIKELFNIFGK